jgi:hypothetical protein
MGRRANKDGLLIPAVEDWYLVSLKVVVGFFLLLLLLFLQYWGLNSGPTPRVSRTICLGLAWNLNPPDLCLLSS